MALRAEVVLSDEEREVLERWARRPKSSQALALRCRIVLAAADGESEHGDRGAVGVQSVRRSASGGGGSRGGVLMGCMTSRGRASRARSAMRTSSG